ncbi:hypothetical protein [Ferruginibacter sp. SUN106]|uniref:hypothetical protein n=1 Tax=Ferruginibacter sp. SUN106 TaxID=2978348 RepID=UPI003D359BCF
MITQKANAVKPYNTKELAAKYGVTPKVLRMWLLPHNQVIGEKTGRYFTILQIKKIFDLLGEPD